MGEGHAPQQCHQRPRNAQPLNVLVWAWPGGVGSGPGEAQGVLWEIICPRPPSGPTLLSQAPWQEAFCARCPEHQPQASCRRDTEGAGPAAGVQGRKWGPGWEPGSRVGAGSAAQRAEGGYSRAHNQGGRAERTGWAAGGALRGGWGGFAWGALRGAGGSAGSMKGRWPSQRWLPSSHTTGPSSGHRCLLWPISQRQPRDGGTGASAHSLQPPGPRQASRGSSIPTPGGPWAACPGCRGCTHGPEAHSQHWELAPSLLLGHLEPCCPRQPWRRHGAPVQRVGAHSACRTLTEGPAPPPPSCRPSSSAASVSLQCPLAAGHPSAHTPLSLETQLAMGPRQPSPGASYPTYPTCS